MYTNNKTFINHMYEQYNIFTYDYYSRINKLKFNKVVYYLFTWIVCLAYSTNGNIQHYQEDTYNTIR